MPGLGAPSPTVNLDWWVCAGFLAMGTRRSSQFHGLTVMVVLVVMALKLVLFSASGMEGLNKDSSGIRSGQSEHPTRTAKCRQKRYVS